MNDRLKSARSSVTTAAAAALLLALCAGCTSVRTNVSLDAPMRPHWNVLVLPLDDRDGHRASHDYSLYGSTGTQGSATMAARSVSWAFGANSAFSPVPPEKIFDAIEHAKLTLPQAAHIESGKACDLARQVDANMVVIGRVPAYETYWFLFIPCAKVSIEMQAYDPSNYRLLWTAQATKRRLFSTEKQLVFDVARQVAQDVNERMVEAE